MDEQQVLRSPFDIETHKKTFINYLEVVILPDGTVEYAVPSHQEKLIRLCCAKDNITRQQLDDLVPREYYADMFTWLTAYSGSVAVWNDFYMGFPNPEQVNTLQELASHGLYRGKIE